MTVKTWARDVWKFFSGKTKPVPRRRCVVTKYQPMNTDLIGLERESSQKLVSSANQVRRSVGNLMEAVKVSYG